MPAAYQQLLTVTSDKTEGTVEENVSQLLKGLFEEIRKNKSFRKDTDIVHEIVPSKYDLPTTASIEKLKTKWEKFAESKGIKRRKKDRLVYSEEYSAWLPRWGSNSAKNLTLRGGIVEGKSFEKLRKEKAERVAKNEKKCEVNRKIEK